MRDAGSPRRGAALYGQLCVLGYSVLLLFTEAWFYIVGLNTLLESRYGSCGTSCMAGGQIVRSHSAVMELGML